MFTVKENARPLFAGNVMLILCCAFYLIWWIVSFQPKIQAPIVLSSTLFVLTALFGILGLFFIIQSMMAIGSQKEFISTNIISFGGIILYVFLFLFTYYALQRQLTTELFLILAWAALALFEINKLYGIDQIKKSTAMHLCLLIGLGLILSLFCYIIYYRLPAQAAYVDGMIPLALIGIIMTIITSNIKN